MKKISLILFYLLIITALIFLSCTTSPGGDDNGNSSSSVVSSDNSSINSSDSSSSSSSKSSNSSSESSFSQPAWSQISVSGAKPGARIYAKMAYIGDSKIILFGGIENYTTGPLNDTWEYNKLTNTWTKYNVTGTLPPVRSGFDMVYFGGTKIIMFGGFGISAPYYLNDTWEFDLVSHTWQQYNTTGTVPEVRSYHAMAYAGGNKLIMFGGNKSSSPNYLNDTWEYDVYNHTWTQYNMTGSAPSLRSMHSMSYAGGFKILLFGGSNNPSGSDLNETWEYDASTHAWSQYNLTGTKPSGRHSFAMAYKGGSTVALFGGLSPGESYPVDYCWLYDMSAHEWTDYYYPFGSAPAPETRYGHSMAEDGNSGVILFSGGNNSYVDDMWLWK